MKAKRKMDISVFAVRLRELRKNEGLTQYALGKQTGIGKASIENYEKRKTIPSSNNIYILCKFLKCTSDYLIGLSDNSVLSPSAMEGAKLINSMNRDEQEWATFIVEAIVIHVESFHKVERRIKSQSFMTKLLTKQ